MTSRFVGPEALREIFEGKAVALVGSGPGCLENPPGFVDSHQVVVRVNNYVCKSGSGAGMRTDVHYSFYGRSIRKTAAELERDGVKLCMCKCPDAKFMDSPWHEAQNKPHGVDFRFIYQGRQAFWFCPTYVPDLESFKRTFDLLGGHVPTTGFAALLEVLAHKPRHLFLTGFDFFQSGVHNGNERWRPGDPTDPIGHVPDKEREWLAANVEKLPITMDATLTKALLGLIKRQVFPEKLRYRARRMRA